MYFRILSFDGVSGVNFRWDGSFGKHFISSLEPQDVYDGKIGLTEIRDF